MPRTGRRRRAAGRGAAGQPCPRVAPSSGPQRRLDAPGAAPPAGDPTPPGADERDPPTSAPAGGLPGRGDRPGLLPTAGPRPCRAAGRPAAREREVAAQGERLVQVSAIAQSMTQVLKGLRVGLSQASFQQRRQLVELLIDRVVVTDGQVEIRYVIPTTPGSTTTRF